MPYCGTLWAWYRRKGFWEIVFNIDCWKFGKSGEKRETSMLSGHDRGWYAVFRCDVKCLHFTIVIFKDMCNLRIDGSDRKMIIDIFEGRKDLKVISNHGWIHERTLIL